MNMFFQVLAAAIGVIAFAVLFRAPRKYYLDCGIAGGIGAVAVHHDTAGLADVGVAVHRLGVGIGTGHGNGGHAGQGFQICQAGGGGADREAVQDDLVGAADGHAAALLQDPGYDGVLGLFQLPPGV